MILNNVYGVQNIQLLNGYEYRLVYLVLYLLFLNEPFSLYLLVTNNVIQKLFSIRTSIGSPTYTVGSNRLH